MVCLPSNCQSLGSAFNENNVISLLSFLVHMYPVLTGTVYMCTGWVTSSTSPSLPYLPLPPSPPPPSLTSAFLPLPNWCCLQVYWMSKEKYRGRALIINNYYFEHQTKEGGLKLDNRYGSDMETFNMKKCLEALHFQIQVMTDLKSEVSR